MKRYWLFGGDIFYALGGFSDMQGNFSTEKEAVEHGEQFDWYEVFDTRFEEIVASSKYGAYGTHRAWPAELPE